MHVANAIPTIVQTLTKTVKFVFDSPRWYMSSLSRNTCPGSRFGTLLVMNSSCMRSFAFKTRSGVSWAFGRTFIGTGTCFPVSTSLYDRGAGATCFEPSLLFPAGKALSVSRLSAGVVSGLFVMLKFCFALTLEGAGVFELRRSRRHR